MSHGRKQRSMNATRPFLADRRMARNLDKLAQFELFDKNIMPQLKKMVLENWSPEKIRKAFAPIMQARMIQAGLGDIRANNTMKAIKDTLDRHEGMAVQRVENKTALVQMSKKELAALCLQRLKDANVISATGQVLRNLDDDEESS